MEILTAYVRKNAPIEQTKKDVDSDKKEKNEQVETDNNEKLSPDIQAILRVLIDRDIDHEKGADFFLDLRRANLTSGELWRVNLQRATLWETNLQKAVLLEANLQEAYLRGANLQGADLKKANLQGAINLEVEQLCMAKTLYKAILDPELERQVKEKCPHLLEKPEDEN
jgi:hypothetical protein